MILDPSMRIVASLMGNFPVPSIRLHPTIALDKTSN